MNTKDMPLREKWREKRGNIALCVGPLTDGNKDKERYQKTFYLSQCGYYVRDGKTRSFLLCIPLLKCEFERSRSEQVGNVRSMHARSGGLKLECLY